MFGWFTHRSWRRVQGLLSEYVDGRLDAKSSARIEAYLASHPEAQEHLDELHSAVGLLRATAMEEEPRSFALTHAPVQAPSYDAPRRFAPLRAFQVATATAAVALAVLVTTDITGTFDASAPPDVTNGTVAEALRQTLDESEVIKEVGIAVEKEVVKEAQVEMAEPEAESAIAAAAVPIDEPLTTPQPNSPGLATESDRLVPPVEPETSDALAAPAATLEPEGRRAHEWAILALALALALLAVVTLGWSWRVAQRRTG